jgi:hypothetical protein
MFATFVFVGAYLHNHVTNLDDLVHSIAQLRVYRFVFISLERLDIHRAMSFQNGVCHCSSFVPHNHPDQ